ncbi:hypothetical protein B0H14DRAFT_3490656 [Mycena olivaceomarginata]|nr:hypothetical protein B0H14DRAFT_3490656 [Mycena olivaceomarginata]
MAEELIHTRHKKRRLGPGGLNDSLASWIPAPEDDFSEDAAHIGTVTPGNPLDPPIVLGDDLENPHCALCETAYDAGVPNPTRIFKCYDCGQFVQCISCCLSSHQRSPLHEIQEWNGSFWVNSTLREIGLIYQLGHGGFSCPFPDDLARTMTVIEAPIIHEIRMRYCRCAKSDNADNLEQLMRNAWYPGHGD